jgi:uncharacterized protein YraI
MSIAPSIRAFAIFTLTLAISTAPIEYAKARSIIYQVNDQVSLGYLNVRTGPGLQYQVVGRINAGQPVVGQGVCMADQRGKPWCLVTNVAITGWMSATFLIIRGHINLSIDGASEVAIFKISQRASLGYLNARKGPGLGFPVVGRVSAGKSVVGSGSCSRDERGVAWCFVSDGKTTGWIVVGVRFNLYATRLPRRGCPMGGRFFASAAIKACKCAPCHQAQSREASARRTSTRLFYCGKTRECLLSGAEFG